MRDVKITATLPELEIYSQKSIGKIKPGKEVEATLNLELTDYNYPINYNYYIPDYYLPSNIISGYYDLKISVYASELKRTKYRTIYLRK